MKSALNKPSPRVKGSEKVKDLSLFSVIVSSLYFSGCDGGSYRRLRRRLFALFNHVKAVFHKQKSAGMASDANISISPPSTAHTSLLRSRMS